MEILKASDGEEPQRAERLRILKDMLSYFDIKSIYALSDHKGLLTVIWDSEPKTQDLNKVKEAWGFFHENEIEHKLVIYKGL